MDYKLLFKRNNWVYIIFFGVVLFGVIRGTLSDGDFKGYIVTGKLVAEGEFIYKAYINTWPPLFALVCLPLSLITAPIQPILYFVWLLTTVAAFLWSTAFIVNLVKKKPFSFLPKTNHIALSHKTMAIPILLILKFLLDNLVNVQINVFFLAMCLLMVKYYQKEKYWIVGILLALSISLKVYTIFFLAYFICKRATKTVLWSLLFLLIFNFIPFMYWGTDLATEYYTHWVTKIVAHQSDFVDHKNQSIFGTFFRFLTTLDPGDNMYINVADLSAHAVKLLTYFTIFIASGIPIYLFREKTKNKNSLLAILEYSIIFNAIPILSPISWKAYFIFLWLPIFLLYQLLYHSNIAIKGLRIAFVVAMILLIGSSELFTGSYFSDVLESYSAYTIGAVILLIIQLVLYYKQSEEGLSVVLKKN